MLRTSSTCCSARESPSPARSARRSTPPRRAVLASVEGGAGTVDAVAAGAAVSFSDALVVLAGLERDGYVQTDPTGRYSRTAQGQPELLAHG